MDESVYEKLTRYCSYQERCETDVKKKLKALKVEESAAVYLERLKQDNYLNVERFTKAFVAGHVRKKWGKTKIKMALQRRGIPAEIIKNNLDGVEDENYQERLQKAAAQKWPRIKAANMALRKRKLFAFLMGKGYETEQIKKAIAALNLRE
jgi:regulatory protein